VASYLEARELPHVWYEADVGDTDPATFVHYMRLAAQQLAGKHAKALPAFSPEPEQNLARFARSCYYEWANFAPLEHAAAGVRAPARKQRPGA